MLRLVLWVFRRQAEPSIPRHRDEGGSVGYDEGKRCRWSSGRGSVAVDDVTRENVYVALVVSWWYGGSVLCCVCCPVVGCR